MVITEYGYGDSYWRVIVEDNETQTSEYFARELILFKPDTVEVDAVAPEDQYFECDFVDI